MWVWWVMELGCGWWVKKKSPLPVLNKPRLFWPTDLIATTEIQSTDVTTLTLFNTRRIWRYFKRGWVEFESKNVGSGFKIDTVLRAERFEAAGFRFQVFESLIRRQQTAKTFRFSGSPPELEDYKTRSRDGQIPKETGLVESNFAKKEVTEKFE